MSEKFDAAVRVHRFLVENQWRDSMLIGPDPGVRFNYRIWRFLKSYAPNINWNDDLYYMQAQGYWILGNWALFRRTQDQQYHDIAVQCSKGVLEHQRADGAWEYPNPEWKGRVATAEGAWAAIGLLETYRQTQDQTILDGIQKWYDFLINTIGFQAVDDELAINYFASRPAGRVPNNTAFVLRFLAELVELTDDPQYCDYCEAMVRFMANVQTDEGEIPYQVPGPNGGENVPHFQTFQYNSFQCLDMLKYYELTKDEISLQLVKKLLKFLTTGQAKDGQSRYDYDTVRRTVNYHTAVMAAAFAEATQRGIGDYQAEADRAYAYLLKRQRANGSFPHSTGDYGFLSDRRAYPRYLAMILVHLLQEQE